MNSGAEVLVLTTKDTEDLIFGCAPADLSGTKLTVIVGVYGGSYKKEITVPAEKAFKAGVISKFSVDMSTSMIYRRNQH